MKRIIITTILALSLGMMMLAAPLLSLNNNADAQQSIKPPKDFKCPTKVQVKLQDVAKDTWYGVSLAEMFMGKMAGDQKSLTFTFNFAKGNPIWTIPTEPEQQGMSPMPNPMPEPVPGVQPVSCPAPGSLLIGYVNGDIFAVEVKDTYKPTKVSITVPKVEPPVEPPACPPEGNPADPNCPPIEPPICPIENNGTIPECPLPPIEPPGNTTEPLPGNTTQPGNNTNPGNTTQPGNTTEPLPGNNTEPTTPNGTVPGNETTPQGFIDQLFN